MRSSLPSPVTSATANFARLNRKVFGSVVSHTDSANVSPSGFGSRTAIWRLASPAAGSSRAICDFPFPLKSPLAATPKPTGLTEWAGLRGGMGVGVGVGDDCACSPAVGAGIEPWVVTTKHSRHPANLQGNPPDLMRATFLADERPA